MMYTSQAYKNGDWWTAQCDQVPGAISQVSELDQAGAAQREAIAFVLDVPARSISVQVTLRPTVATPTEQEATHTELVEAVLSSAALTRRTLQDLKDVVDDVKNGVIPGSGGNLLSLTIGEVEAVQLVEAGYARMVRDQMGGMTTIVATAAGRKITAQVQRQLSKIPRPTPAG
jgi:hypothetical protein